MSFNTRKLFQKDSGYGYPQSFDPNKPFQRVASKSSIMGIYEKPKNPTLPVLTPYEIAALVKSEVSKIMQQRPPAEKIIEKQIIKEVPKEDKTVYAEQTKIDELKSEIKVLKDMIDEFKQIIPLLGSRGGSGVIGIPPPEGNESKILTVHKNMAQWKTVGSSIGSSDTYTPSNVTTDRSFDADSTSIDELADVLGSLIVSLQGVGIVQ